MCRRTAYASFIRRALRDRSAAERHGRARCCISRARLRGVALHRWRVLNLAATALLTTAAMAIAEATEFPSTDIQKFCSVLAYDTLVDEAYCIELEKRYRSMALQEWLRASDHTQRECQDFQDYVTIWYCLRQN
jgi:hypothetical protein